MQNLELFDIIERFPPRFVLDGYHQIFLALRAGLFTQEEKLSLLGELLALSGLSPKALEVILDDILSLLGEEFIVSHREGLFKTEEFEIVYKVLNQCLRDSPRRMVAWAVWRAQARKNGKITIDDILQEVSYPEEVYEIALREISNLEHFGVRRRNFLLEDPYERIIGIKEIYPEVEDPEIIIKKIRELEAHEVSKILRRLGIKDKRLKNINLKRIRRILLECYGGIWPFFGNILIIDDPYFKLFRGQSSTLYVDLPNEIIGFIITRIRDISKASRTEKEFYEKAGMFLDEANRRLDELGISWLRFSLQSNKFMKKKPYGLKIQVRWDKFVEFVESFPNDPNISIWEKYQYISSSRLPVLVEMLQRGEKQYRYFQRVQKGVRMLFGRDMEFIENTLIEIKTILGAMQKKLWRISKKKELPLAMLAYLLEARVVIETIHQMAKEGLFPSCYRELRKLLENFSWAFFGDYLLIRAYKRHNFLYHNYAFIASKGWYEWVRKNNKELILNTKTARKKIDGLHKELKQAYSSLPGKDKFWSVFMSEITFPSFTFIFGGEVNGETLPMEVPRYFLPQIIQYALKDFEKIGEALGLPNPGGFGEDVVRAVVRTSKTTKSAFIVPPYLTNDLVLTLVEKWSGVTELNKKYEEYSTFVHSYSDSWVILPFSSVIEVKVFKKEIMDIENMIKELCRVYLDIFKAKS